jgi:hypothetical protein
METLRIKIDFTYKNIVNKIGGDFPFYLVFNIMDELKWTYYDSKYTPTTDRLKEALYKLIMGCKEGSSTGTGGFNVNLTNDKYNVKFIIGSWIFSKKSINYNCDDLVYLDNFINKVQLTQNIIDSNMVILSNEGEKMLFFKRKCDEFIDSGEEYHYDKKLGLEFIKESYDEEGDVYKLNFIGVEKEYKI